MSSIRMYDVGPTSSSRALVVELDMTPTSHFAIEVRFCESPGTFLGLALAFRILQRLA